MVAQVHPKHHAYMPIAHNLPRLVRILCTLCVPFVICFGLVCQGRVGGRMGLSNPAYQLRAVRLFSEGGQVVGHGLGSRVETHA